VAIYVKNSISYKRCIYLEKENMHIIILDIEISPPVQIITIYRTLTHRVDAHPEKISENN
jgi:hypothetical protein